MQVERLYRDLALALTGSNPDHDLLELKAAHGSAVTWFTELYDAERKLMGSEAASSLGAELAALADVVAGSPDGDLDPVHVFNGYSLANQSPEDFQRWASLIPEGEKYHAQAQHGHARAFALFSMGRPPRPTEVAVDQTAATRGLVNLARRSETIFDAWVDSADCPIADIRRAAAAPGEMHVACRDSKNITGCPYFQGVGVDERVRCAAARVAQMAGEPAKCANCNHLENQHVHGECVAGGWKPRSGEPPAQFLSEERRSCSCKGFVPAQKTAQMQQPPKAGDELEVKKSDGTTSKVKVDRVDPNGSAVVEPTWDNKPGPPSPV